MRMGWTQWLEKGLHVPEDGYAMVVIKDGIANL